MSQASVFAVPKLFTFKYLKSNNTQEFLTCKDGIDSIQGDLNKQITLTEGFIASKLFPNYDDALSKYQTSHKTALDYLTTASTTASNNLTQAIMVNEIQQSVGNYASSLGNNTLTPYEQANSAKAVSFNTFAPRTKPL